jgi:glutaredoxin
MKNENIKIYSTSWCPSCDYAKRFFKDKGLSYEEINIEEKGWSREDLFDITGGRTVPQIVIKGKTIGGYDDLMKLNSEKKLSI